MQCLEGSEYGLAVQKFCGSLFQSQTQRNRLFRPRSAVRNWFATPSAIKNVVSMKVKPDLFWVNALVAL